LGVEGYDPNKIAAPVPAETNTQPAGTFRFNYLATDVKTFVNGAEVTGYNIGGQTIIWFDHLAAYGDVSWNGDTKTLSLVTR
jgi:hypothetical protein